MFIKMEQMEAKQHRWLLCFLVPFCISLAICALVFPQLNTVIAYILVAALLLSSIVSLKKHWRLIGTVALGVAAGIAYFTLFSTVYYQPKIDEFSGSNHISLEITSYSKGINDYGTAEGTVFAINGKKCSPQAVKIYFSDGSPNYIPGEKFSFDAEIAQSTSPQDGVFLNASQRSDLVNISDGKMSVKSQFAKLSHSIATKIDKMASGDGALLLKALLCGDRSAFTQNFRNALGRSGTSHITAVSGMHISIVMAFIMLLFGKKVGVFVALPVIFMFAAMTGFSYSVMRAVIMGSMTVLAFIFKRENDTLTALLTALGILLCLNPFAISSISLLLSFGAVLGIVLFCPMLTRIFIAKPPKNKIAAKIFHYIMSCTAASISALIFTMPLSLIFFTTTSIVSIFSNILILWAVTVIMCLGIIAVALAFLFEPLGQMIFTFALMPMANGMIFVIYTMAKLPFSAVSASSVYFIAWMIMAELMFLHFLHKKKINGFLLLGLGLALVLCAGASVVENNYTEQISIVNTDGSAAILVKNGGKPVIINCGAARGGRNFTRIQNKLFEWGYHSTETLLLTGLDSSNVGGIDYLVNASLIHDIYAPNGDTPITESNHFTYDKSGDISLESGTIQLYKVTDGAFISLLNTGKLRLMNTCGLEPLNAMMTIWDSKLQADIIIIDEKMMQSSYAIEQICKISMPRMLVCANSGYSYLSSIESVFPGQVSDLKQLEEIEIKHWVR